MNFIDSDDSWNLFESAAFANENLPSELKSIGKQIVDKCRGLPLTIVVVAGLLSKSGRTIEDWKNVAKDVKSFVTNDPDEQCLHVLGLSYCHLPGDLKACLLYFGVFPEDSEISVDRLLRLWMAEGFLKLEKDLEWEAEKCLQDLIDRCLVLVCKRSRDEIKIKSCKVHDMIYEMCLREAETRNFFITDNVPNHVLPGSYRALLIPGHHHLIRGQADDDKKNHLRRSRSIFSFSRYDTFTLPSVLTHFNLLRILDLSHIELYHFPQQMLCLIWLRYLALLRCDEGIPPEICRLCNLQTLIIEKGPTTSIFTEQIWELTKLRHLRLNRFKMSNPPSVYVEEECYLGFSEVQTFQGLSPSSCTKEVILGIRNVKKLGIYGYHNGYESYKANRLDENLVNLLQLETLSFENVDPFTCITTPSMIISAKAFPATLKKLKLKKTCLRWADLNIVGELPNLEVLKLKKDACIGKEWHPIVGGFTQLKVLRIKRCPLKYWKATNDNFPILECLFIENCLKLKEIPTEFADIQTLQLNDLQGCRPEVKACATQIQQEQEDLGNQPIHVRIGESFNDVFYGGIVCLCPCICCFFCCRDLIYCCRHR